MKRRSFLGALAALMAAPRALEEVLRPAAASPAPELVPDWRESVRVRGTVRQGLPPMGFRQLNRGTYGRLEYTHSSKLRDGEYALAKPFTVRPGETVLGHGDGAVVVRFREVQL